MSSFMEHTFDKYKNRLKEAAALIEETHQGCSVSKIKSELIAWLLKNAELSISEDDIFVSEIHHAGIMWDFQWKRMRAIEAAEKPGKIVPFNESNTVKAGMDFGHIAPDWLLIYQIGNGIIVFERTGSHSDLF